MKNTGTNLFNTLINEIKKAEINVNRKMLAEMAVNDPKAFTEIVTAIKKA
jgi:large subunit ribosomal protein L20